jgi:AAA domain
MLDVEIHNFQSIDHVHVRVEGFTALVGRSNLGKSAIVRAIKSALTGAPEDNDVRHNSTCERETKGTKTCKCYCSVHLKTEGMDLLWEKGGDKNEYVINGERKTAVGKGTPEFLESAFGLVKIGDRKILLQVADQFRHEGGGPIFLLDETGSVIADVLSDVAQLDRINIASRMAEKDRRECVAQRKVREKDVMALKIKVASYQGLDDVLTLVRETEAEEHRIAEQRARRDKIVGLKNAFITAGREFKILREISTITVPDWAPVSSLYAKCKAIAGFIAATTVRQSVIARLEGVDAITPPDFSPVSAAGTRFIKFTAWVTKLRTYKELFARAKVLETRPTPEITPLLETWRGVLKIASLHARGKAAHDAVVRLEQACAAIETDYEAVKAEEADLGVCPTCAQALDLTHEHAAE